MIQRSLLYNSRSPLKIAHRCGHPENTVESLSKSVKKGCDMVEFDVQLSKDDIPVIIHDTTLDRTTTGKGLVKNYTSAELERYNVPTFENFVEILQNPLQTYLAIELKSIDHIKNRVMIDKVHHILREHKISHRCILISFDVNIVKESKKLFPELLTGIIYGPYNFRNPMWLYHYSKADVLWLYYKLLPRVRCYDLPICVWTVNKKSEIDFILKSRNIMGIVTDRYDLLP